MNSNHRMITRSTSVSSLVGQDGNTLKRSRGELDKDGEMDEVTDLADLWSKIQNMMSSSAALREEKFNNIESKIDACKSDLEDRIDGIEHKLAELKNECNSNVQNIAGTVDVIRHELDHTKEGIDRLGRSQDVLISGVPYLQNENLLGLFRNIANSLTTYYKIISPKLFVSIRRYDCIILITLNAQSTILIFICLVSNHSISDRKISRMLEVHCGLEYPK